MGACRGKYRGASGQSLPEEAVVAAWAAAAVLESRMERAAGAEMEAQAEDWLSVLE